MLPQHIHGFIDCKWVRNLKGHLIKDERFVLSELEINTTENDGKIRRLQKGSGIICVFYLSKESYLVKLGFQWDGVGEVKRYRICKCSGSFLSFTLKPHNAAPSEMKSSSPQCEASCYPSGDRKISLSLFLSAA